MIKSAVSATKRLLGRTRRLWVHRAALDALLLSGNEAFIRFAPPGHFYSPLPDACTITSARTRALDQAASDELPGIDLNCAVQLALLEEFEQVRTQLPYSEHQTPKARFHLDNPYFSYGDAVILFGMLRRFRPRRIVEVGSGYSSAAMLDAAEANPEAPIEFTFIEPHPERLLTLLRPTDGAHQVIETLPVQNVPLTRFELLEANDILFIDSSHVLKIGSDVQYLLFEVLPRLQTGVLIHFHDVLWPFEYPELWFRQGRAWNEAYALRAFLQYNRTFEILCFNDYLGCRHRERLERHLPLALTPPSSRETPGLSSLWLRKRQ